MSDSEYSSEDDEDYVLPDENQSNSSESDEEDRNKSNTNKKPKQQRSRRREGGIRLEGPSENIDSGCSDDENRRNRELFDKEEAIAKQQKLEAARKEKEEDLWASFKKDTGMTASKSSKMPVLKGAPSCLTHNTEAKPSSSSSKKVSITKTYDFAGESVTVTKTVEADSREAQRAKKEIPGESTKMETKPLAKSLGCGGFKRPGGLSNFLGQISKKPKMSTLEKSKMDWDVFKQQEGLEDELRNYNKDGYLEKQAFLQRTDERKFELERDARQGSRRR